MHETRLRFLWQPRETKKTRILLSGRRPPLSLTQLKIKKTMMESTSLPYGRSAFAIDFTLRIQRTKRERSSVPSYSTSARTRNITSGQTNTSSAVDRYSRHSYYISQGSSRKKRSLKRRLLTSNFLLWWSDPRIVTYV